MHEFQAKIITPEMVVAEARRYLGVGFKHQGLTASGLDCSGLVLLTGKNLEQVPSDLRRAAYSLLPHPRLFAELTLHLDSVQGEAIDGDIFLMCHRAHKRKPAHLAFKTPLGLLHIHPAESLNRVAEHSLRDEWPSLILETFRFKGVRA